MFYNGSSVFVLDEIQHLTGGQQRCYICSSVTKEKRISSNYICVDDFRNSLLCFLQLVLVETWMFL